ncbi:chorismate synthase [Desulfosalsimonas propionicica]|uniref:Chorismate synthase n=1 Tax=Desulfosalsimonas propionicica TaxID=332175 RepID=A0A7W0C7S2_9BACT|nr:chorismate synthase [Desulfosalsimonas propionicica]MBA2880630.1 chorismate synthase [Desulfosalsimonas propionicica]
MAGNTFGTLFKVTTWGESHGPAVGAVIDGCPPKICLTETFIQEMMDRRKPGQTKTGTARREADQARILSGVFEDQTTGTSICLLIENKDARSDAYKPYADLYRPGHGDFTYQAKYGIRDWRGGGRASARETAARVAAGAVAAALLNQHNIRVMAYTRALGGIECRDFDPQAIGQNLFCAPDMKAAAKMEKRVDEVKKAGDSLGGIVEIRVSGVLAGLGEPVFDKLDADLAKALMSIGAVKGVEIGAGFAAAAMTGSAHNDPITPQGFLSNNAGGILAGISSGQDLVMRAAVKPIASIAMEQNTVDQTGSPRQISVKGRHDISAIPRVNVVCEAMVCLVLADHLLRQKILDHSASSSNSTRG